ncbi:MAG: bifunctional riboflavin kinase/FAD synthetase [Paracoccaceae bacterium]|jgi:riboflavin kinase/FMN adenylyltransferase|tara:strand:- start:9027 stop:9959 length:933 start_codon:yes stop_codon:yes gene_type:complete
MLIFNSIENIPKDDNGYSVAIGNFDGMHLGHQSVIDIARKTRDKSSVGVVTFEPHPRQYFQKNHSIFRLMKSETRKRFLESFKVDALFELPFDYSLANLSPKDFVETVLLEKLNVRNIVVGPDFRFGKNREGSVNLLKSYQEKKKLGLHIANPFMIEGKVVSSSELRKKLAEGSVIEVTRMLSRYYEIDGIVEKGFQRGRKLGFPTINIGLKNTIVPKHGVYAVLIKILSNNKQRTLKGAASIGSRPTYGDYEPNIEVFIFDFDENLYGAYVSISLVKFIRPELKFNSEVELISQMKEDCRIIKDYLDND